MSIVASLMSLAVAWSVADSSPRWQGATIGQSYAELASTYLGAKVSGSERAQTLELREVSYSGVRWRKVVMAFDVSRHLDHVTFTVHGADYDSLKARLDATLDAGPSAGDGVKVASATPFDVEMRICQFDNDDIAVTFERPRYAS